MITLEQIRQLETKIHKVVSHMAALREENISLRTKLDQHEKRVSELEGMIAAFKEDQAEIEQGIITALEQLDRLEDSVDRSPSSTENSDEEKAQFEDDVVEVDDDTVIVEAEDKYEYSDADLPEEIETSQEDHPVEADPESSEDDEVQNRSTEGELDIF